MASCELGDLEVVGRWREMMIGPFVGRRGRLYSFIGRFRPGSKYPKFGSIRFGPPDLVLTEPRIILQ